MKLRNKKTGGLANCEPIEVKTDAGFHDYYSLAELNQDWEDYTPSEPLIKDEKIRKAVRAWAEANGFTNEIGVRSLNAGTRFSEGHWSIEFIGYFIYDLEIDSTYTIAELCGEEEE